MRDEQVVERLDERQAHVLLLEREAHLGGERLLDLRRREPERLREAEAGLERDDQEVDQVGKAALDLLAALSRPRADDVHRKHPAEHGGADRSRAARGRLLAPARLASQSMRNAPPTAESELRPEQAVGRRGVHARRDEARAVVLAAQAGEVLGRATVPPSPAMSSKCAAQALPRLAGRGVREASPRTRTRRSARSSRWKARRERSARGSPS